MPKVSVSIAMAAYRGHAYIGEQLRSLVEQERLPDELVVTDDSPDDATANIVNEFARNSSFPVRLHRNTQRLGYNRNFEHAASLCTGDVILFADQDDFWLPGHVRRLVECFEADSAVGFAVSNSLYVDAELNRGGGDLWEAERFTSADFRRAMTQPQFPSWVRHRALAGHAMGFRADLRPLVLPFSGNWIYDQWVALVSVACSRAVIIREPLTLHRHHPDQSVANDAVPLGQLYSATPTLGTDHFQSQIQAWQDLLDRLETHSSRLTGSQVLPAVRGRLRILRARSEMRGGSPFRRIVLAVSQLIRGNYHKHGRGWLTFARDIAGVIFALIWNFVLRHKL